MQFISPREALAKATKEGARLIDVRTPAEYRTIRAAGAELHELSTLSEAYIDHTLLAKGADTPLLILCKSGRRAAQAAKKIEGRTKAPVLVVEGGTDLWDEQKLPVEKGTAVMSLERQVRITAGGLVLIGTLAGYFSNQTFLVVPAFVGAGLVFAGVTDTCAMGMLLAKMPWNR
jgi:rhodanese-related sulfurtransferase